MLAAILKLPHLPFYKCSCFNVAFVLVGGGLKDHI